MDFDYHFPNMFSVCLLLPKEKVFIYGGTLKKRILLYYYFQHVFSFFQRARASDSGLPDAAVQAVPSAGHVLRLLLRRTVHDKHLPAHQRRDQPGEFY